MAMHAIERWFSRYLAWLCAIFAVTPETLRDGRRGNLPPPEGGFGAR
jgi:hypothetical protein